MQGAGGNLQTLEHHLAVFPKEEADQEEKEVMRVKQDCGIQHTSLPDQRICKFVLSAWLLRRGSHPLH